MKISISKKNRDILELIKLSFENGIQTQYYNDNFDHWLDIEDKEHHFDVSLYDYRCINDGEIENELIVVLTD